MDNKKETVQKREITFAVQEGRFISIRNKVGPSMEPWGTPSFVQICVKIPGRF